MGDVKNTAMRSFIGSDHQLCNALMHIAHRESTGNTDSAVCFAAATIIRAMIEEKTNG